MQDVDDLTLLREYAARDSEAAFAELVSRRVGFVYSAALRQVRDPHLAEEITQAVFIILAQKAGRISDKTILAGWLFKTTRYAAIAQARDAAKRSLRTATIEKEFQMQTEIQSTAPDALWEQMSPLLDEALATLGETDRQAVLLRFFENKSLAEVGSHLGTGEDTARKRVARALEKLHRYFNKRGVSSTTAVLAGTISANSVQAAPVTLGKAVTATAFAKGAAASGSTLTLIKGALKLMAWTKAKTVILVGVSMILAAVIISAVVSSTGQNRDARQILERVRENYESLSSYNSTGETIEDIDNKIITASFSMRLGRTNLYFVEYEQQAPSFTNKGAVWSDGSGDYFANDMVNKAPKPPGSGVLNTNRIIKSPFPGSANNLSLIWDVSGGATLVVPAMFFGIQIPTASQERAWSKLVQPTTWDMARLAQEPDEKVGETDCRVLSIETDDGKAWLWIGKEDFLVHQSQQRVKSKLPEATDSEIAAMLAKIPGQQPLSDEEMKKRINDGRKKATASMKSVTVVFSENKGTSGLKSMTIDPPSITTFTQTHENIVVNKKFSPIDFTR